MRPAPRRLVPMKQTRKPLLIVALLALGVFGVITGILVSAHGALGQPTPSNASPSDEEKKAANAAGCCKAGDTTPPTELVKQVPKGQLHSPYPDYAKLAKDDPDLVKQFRLPGCNECHGGTGGGGICPAVTQGVWFWGNTDDVLFRLVTLGSVDLEKEGYTVELAGSGLDALSKLETAKPALVILDIMLPDTDGFEVCRQIRSRSEVPVLMLTARKDDIDKILGLELGADDYLTKPFNPRELVARVKAVLRRYAAGQKPGKLIEAGNLKIDAARREVLIDGSAIKLRTKEFDLLMVLAQNFGVVMTRERLLEIVWETDYYGETRTVDIHVNHVRDKIAGADVAIETVRGVGYKLTNKAGSAEPGTSGD